MVRRITYRIDENDEGNRVGSFLKEKGYSTTLIGILKKQTEGIMINQKPVFVTEALRAGDLVEICLEEHVAEEEVTSDCCNLSILYEDEDILVVNKPHDMPVHKSINNYGNTLANAVANYFKENGKAHVFRCINRLDRDTTGATIIAKNALSAAILSKQVKERTLHRTYLALVEGVTKEHGVVDLPIGRKEGSIIERQIDHENGKRAVTHFKRLRVERVKEKEVSLLSLKLETGRTHQIRVHMSHLGHPLLGDFLYNKEDTTMEHQALHSARLTFTHPITGEEMDIVAPIPVERWKVDAVF